MCCVTISHISSSLLKMRGGGVLHQIFGSRVQHAKTDWTQFALKFCKNEGSNRSKINEKRGSIGLKIKMKIDTKCLKSVK